MQLEAIGGCKLNARNLLGQLWVSPISAVFLQWHKALTAYQVERVNVQISTNQALS